MTKSVEELLRELGPSPSSLLAKLFVDGGLNPPAARKRVSRARGDVRRLRRLQLPNRERFLYLRDQENSPAFYENLAHAIEASHGAYSRALHGLLARGGLTPLSYFPIASGLPVSPARGQLPHETVQTSLQELRLINIEETAHGPFVSTLDAASSTGRRASVVLAEDVLLGATRSWLSRTGWASTKTIELRTPDHLPQFGQYAFDLVAPSYLNALAARAASGPKNGFIFADVILDRNVTLGDIHPFLAKWDALASQQRATRFQPIFIADSLSPGALNELRKRGAILALPSGIFGEEIAKALKQLINTVENAAAAVSKDPNKVIELFGRLSKLEGAAFNLRGVLLELTVARLYTLDGYSVDIRQTIKGKDNKPAEIDVKSTKPNVEVVCIECKGKAPGSDVDAPEIEEWLGAPLTRIKEWLKESQTLPNLRRFEFYCSTGYTPAAKALIQKTEAAHIRQPVKFFDGSDILRKLNQKGEMALERIFREQFAPKS